MNAFPSKNRYKRGPAARLRGISGVIVIGSIRRKLEKIRLDGTT
jgi:hypothetical protein